MNPIFMNTIITSLSFLTLGVEANFWYLSLRPLAKIRKHHTTYSECSIQNKAKPTSHYFKVGEHITFDENIETLNCCIT